MAIQIAPSLLACDLSKLGEEISAIDKAGADVIHLDVMDGHFVPNITFGIPVIESVRRYSKLPFDAHLMISNADRFLDAFKRAGCDWLSVHVEACPHLNRTLQRIRELGMRAGVAINPGTSLHALDACLDDVDYILVMSVNPGFGGQSFIGNSFDRVRELKKMLGSRKVQIQIDGGIKEANIHDAAQAGAECFVVGTGFFAATDYADQMKKLKNKAAGK
jgi:ribulose-phosphate 3-epimerase